MLLKFLWYTALSALVVFFCMLNQQPIPVDLYWVQVIAPTHLWLIVSFILGVLFEATRSVLSRLYRYLFSKKAP